MGTFSFKNGLYEYVYKTFLSTPGVSYCGLTIYFSLIESYILGHCSIFLPRFYVIPSWYLSHVIKRGITFKVSTFKNDKYHLYINYG